jgi:hypothetical protein
MKKQELFPLDIINCILDFIHHDTQFLCFALVNSSWRDACHNTRRWENLIKKYPCAEGEITKNFMKRFFVLSKARRKVVSELKVVILGPRAVGRSALYLRYTIGQFVPVYDQLTLVL